MVCQNCCLDCVNVMLSELKSNIKIKLIGEVPLASKKVMTVWWGMGFA